MHDGKVTCFKYLHVILLQIAKATATASTGLLVDYEDGSHFRKHPLLSTVSSFLQIFLYYDDLEVCNPLGSKAKVHKLSMSPQTL